MLLSCRLLAMRVLTLQDAGGPAEAAAKPKHTNQKPALPKNKLCLDTALPRKVHAWLLPEMAAHCSKQCPPDAALTHA
jgi:hypothetical protein